MTLSLHDEARIREQDHYEIELVCAECGAIAIREVWEGEPTPCTALVDGEECGSVEVLRP